MHQRALRTGKEVLSAPSKVDGNGEAIWSEVVFLSQEVNHSKPQIVPKSHEWDRPVWNLGVRHVEVRSLYSIWLRIVQHCSCHILRNAFWLIGFRYRRGNRWLGFRQPKETGQRLRDPSRRRHFEGLQAIVPAVELPIDHFDLGLRRPLNGISWRGLRYWLWTLRVGFPLNLSCMAQHTPVLPFLVVEWIEERCSLE